MADEWKDSDDPELRKLLGHLLRDSVAYQDGAGSYAPALIFADADFEVGDGSTGLHEDGKRANEPAIVYTRADALMEVRAENARMKEALDTEERVAKYGEGGLWRFWAEKARGHAAANKKLRAEVSALRRVVEVVQEQRDVSRDRALDDAYDVAAKSQSALDACATILALRSTSPAPSEAVKPGQYWCESCKRVVWGGDHVCPSRSTVRALTSEGERGFTTSGAEDRWISDTEAACPACGGSGHRGDAAPVEALVEPAAQAIYKVMAWAAHAGPSPDGTVPRWVEDGNSLGQREARITARKVLALAGCHDLKPDHATREALILCRELIEQDNLEAKAGWDAAHQAVTLSLRALTAAQDATQAHEPSRPHAYLDRGRRPHTDDSAEQGGRNG